MKRLSSPKPVGKKRLSPSVDLDELFSGGTFQLDKGEDFGCSASSAAQVIREEFRQRYGRLSIKESTDKQTITVTIVPGRL